jgi:hypothetical protein
MDWHDEAIAHLESAVQLLRARQEYGYALPQAIIEDLQRAKQDIIELKNRS